MNQQNQQPIAFPGKSQPNQIKTPAPQFVTNPQTVPTPQTMAPSTFGSIPQQQQNTAQPGQQTKFNFQQVPDQFKNQQPPQPVSGQPLQFNNNQQNQQNPPQLPGQPLPQPNNTNTQPNNTGFKPFQPNTGFAPKPPGQPGTTLPFQKPENNTLNKPTFPQTQFPNPNPALNPNAALNPMATQNSIAGQNPFPGISNPMFQQTKIPQSIPAQQNYPIPQQKYEPMDVKTEDDKKQLVEKFVTYIKEGNFTFTIECLKQIINNDIRVKVKV